MKGKRTKYRYNKAPLEGKVLHLKTTDEGQQLVYANLNSKESIVIPMDPDELEKYFGSSKDVDSMKRKLTAQKRNLKIKYNELEKVHKKLENIKKEKAKKKEPVHASCDMVLAMISSNLKLANEKLAELEKQCNDLEKVHQQLKLNEEANKKVALDLRAKIRDLSKARKDAALALVSAKRKKSSVQKLLEGVMKMELKVSQMCKGPSVGDVGSVGDAGSVGDVGSVGDAGKPQADKDAQKEADKGQVEDSSASKDAPSYAEKLKARDKAYEEKQRAAETKHIKAKAAKQLKILQSNASKADKAKARKNYNYNREVLSEELGVKIPPPPPSDSAIQAIVAERALAASKASIADQGFPKEAAFGMHNEFFMDDEEQSENDFYY